MLAPRCMIEVREPSPLLRASSDDPAVFQTVWQLLEIGDDWRARCFVGEHDSLFLKGMQIPAWTGSQHWARRFHIGREFRNLVRFRALDLPFPRPLAWGCEMRAGLTLRAFLIEWAIPDSIDFEHFILAPDCVATPEQRRRVFERVGSAVRRMHDQRVFHRDLACRNVLVQDPTREARIYLIDLPLARASERRSGRLRDLYRLTKTALRWGALDDDILVMLREAAGDEARDILAMTRRVRQERRRLIRKLRARTWFWGLC
jgi:tRNA A-37 threonylcarbamoyl transferase component Bud32